MKPMKRLIYLSSMLIANCAFAQLQQYENQNINSFNEGNPDTYSATKSTVYKVNESTGVMGVTVPFFNITQNGFTLPVSINYNASGLRVDETASRIGLGWSLSAGGVVSRSTRGIPDYSTGSQGSGYYQRNTLPGPNQGNLPGVQAILNNVFTGGIDGEPDLTMYSYGNRGGKFFVNPVDGKAYTIPYQNLLIQIGAIGGYPECYSITDEDGNQFLFADIESVIIKDQAGNILSAQKNTSYYLTKIILTDKSEINFAYTYLSYKVFAGNRDTKLDRVYGDPSSGNPCDAIANQSVGATTVQRTSIYLNTTTPRLASITYNQGKIAFTYDGTARTDQPGDYRLSQLVQYDPSGNEVKKYILEHDYTTAYGGGDGRLRLKKITERDKNGNNLLPITFTYENTAFPPVSTPKQDYWGYYNNGANYESFSFLGGGTPGPSLLEYYDTFHKGSDRTINPTYTLTGTLLAINYPDGATVSFSYENNVYRDPISGADMTGPGLRIKMVASNDGLGSIKYTSYQYKIRGTSSSSGKLYDVEVSSDVQFRKRLSFATCPCLLRKADPLSKTPFLAGNAIYYTCVEATEHSDPVNVTASKIGSTVYYYNFNTGYNPQTYLYYIRDHLNGQLLMSTVFNKQGDSVANTTYNYTSTDIKFLSGTLPFIVTMDSVMNKTYGYNTYQIYSTWAPVSSIVTKTYEVGSKTNFKQEITSFTYNSTTLQPDTKTIATGGNTYKTKYKRPFDYTTTVAVDEQSLAIKEQQSKHILTPVIESITVKNGMVIGAELNHYKKLSAGVFPVRSYSLIQMAPYAEAGHTFSTVTAAGNFTFSSNYKKQKEVDVFDPNGAPIEVNQRNSISAVIINPVIDRTIATCSKAVQNDIAYCSFEDYEVITVGALPTLHASSNWILMTNCSTTVRSSDAFAGTGSIQLGGSCNNRMMSAKPLTATTTYRLTLWAKNGNPNVSATGGGVPPYTLLQTTNGWNLYQYIITGVTAITIGMDGSCLIDELKLSPVDADLSNVVYKPLVGVISESNNNNIYTHYVYDNFGRLIKTLDHDLNIRQTVEHIQQEQQ